MSEDNKNFSIFSGVNDAINKNRKRTPKVEKPGVVQNVNGLIKPGSNIENVQQQFLDWQVNKIAHDLYTRTIYYDTDRVNSYQDFRAMDMSPEISAALNIIRDECITRGDKGKILDIFSENSRVKTLLEDLFYNRLDVDFALKLWIRDLLKYGDFFLHLHIDKDEGIYDVMALPSEEIHREEGFEGRTDDVRFRWETTGDYFEDWQIAHFRLLEDNKKLPYGRCLKYNTYIETDSGVKFIKDIEKGDLVSCFDTKTQSKIKTKVLDVVCSGEKEIFKIRTKNNEIETSAEHKILVSDNGDFIYKSADEIKIGDLFVINPNTITDAKIKLNKDLGDDKNFNGYKNSSNLVPEIIDKDFAMLFGFMLGDGWVNNNSVCFALGTDDSLNEKYIGLLERFSGKKIKLRVNPNKKGTLQYSEAKVNSKSLKQILINNGFVGKSYEKRLPEWIFNASKEIQESLVIGLMDADGSEFVDKWNCKRYSIELVSELLVRDLKTLLQRMGRKTGNICSRHRDVGDIWGVTYEKRECFYLYFYDSVITQAKRHDLEDRKTNEFILSPVVSIEKLENKEVVYDIHVESENHNFYANGIVVHNSILDPARKLWKQLQLAEDSLLVYRITRAPERRVFYIDVGNLEHADVGQFIQQFQMQLKKQPIVDQKTGNINMKYNPMNVTEDYFIPMRADRSSKIETLPGACLALDTKIELLDGRSLELNEIIKEFNDGKELWSYSINPSTGEIVPGKISWAGITRKDTQVVKITLDNGETITTTPDHKFPTRFNGIKEAKDLSKGESLWAFNKKFEKIFKNKPKAKKYEMIYNHNQNKWVYTHRMVAEYFKNLSEEGLDKKREIVKFNFKKDSDKLQELLKDKGYKKEGYRNGVIEKQKIKYSNEMLNFVVDRLKNGLTAKEIIFEINSENSLFMNEFSKLNKNNKQLKKMSNGFTHNNLVKMMVSFGYSNWMDFKNKIDYFNHKIVSIEFLEKTQDTGTITIDGSEIYHDYHNFALSVGVFTQNSNLGDIADIEYFQNKLFASLQVPKNYLNYGESLPGGSTLSQQDLRFSRTINTIQQSVLAELKRIANIHLFFNGFEDDINNFTLTLNNPSTQQELLKLETMKARLEVFKEMFSAEATSPVSYVWAMENILGFSKNEIKLMLKQKKVEKKIFAEIDSSVEMYKKIGLFKELDEKFEIPGAEEMMSNQQGSDSEESESFDGGGGFSSGGGFDMSGGEVGGEEVEGEEMSGEDSEEPSGEEAPISEGSIKKAMKVSDYYTSLLINELLGSDEVKKSKKIEDNALVKRNVSMNFESKKLIDSIEKSLSKIDGGKKLIRESDENSLLENSDKLDKDSEILMGEIERFLKNRKNK